MSASSFSRGKSERNTAPARGPPSAGASPHSSWARPGEAPPAKRPMDHFGFVVDTKEDLQAWYDFMKAKGVNLLDTPSDHFDGARSFHCTDPAGNVIQPIFHPAISGQRFEGP